MVHAAPDETLPAQPLRKNAPAGAVLWSPGERSQGAKGGPVRWPRGRGCRGWMRSRTALKGELEGSLLTSWEYFMALATCSQVFWWPVFPLHFPFAFKVLVVVAQVSCHLAYGFMGC